MRSRLRVGARPSSLAIRQVEEIERLLGRAIRFDITLLATLGDRDKTTPLSEVEGSDFFTREIEEALIARDIDLAVHSAKDLEEELPEKLAIAVMTGSISPYECLVSRDGKPLGELTPGATVGTSSLKRREAVLKFRNDLVVKDIRGTIDERLTQLDRGDFDAIIVAHAALIRLGCESRIAQIIPEYIMKPHPLQGRLAIQVRKDRTDLIKLFRGIDAQ